MAPRPPVKLDLSSHASNGDVSSVDWSEVPEGLLPYEELDFSYNGITSTELDRILEICSRCPKLRVLKLFKNSIDDSGAEGIAQLCQSCPGIEEIHLSHNMFTADGATVIIMAAESSRSKDTVPLWLRLEQNHIDDAESVFRRLQDKYSVCRRIDPKACTSRTCAKRCLVHLPHFCLQRLSHVDSHQDLPQLAKTGNPAPARQMLRQFREDLDRQKGKSKGREERVPLAAKGDEQKMRKLTDEEMHRNGNSNGHLNGHSNGHSGNGCSGCGYEDQSTVGGRVPHILAEQLVDQENAQDFFCYLCQGVLHLPILTRCSHLFCSPCFQSWVMERVNEHQTGPTSKSSMQAMPCPICGSGLKKADVMPLHRAQHPAVGIMQRKWHSIKLKCIHHVDFTDPLYPFAEGAAQVKAESGIECQWVGDLPEYAGHCKICPVANALRGAIAAPPPISNGNGYHEESGGSSRFDEDDICVAKYDFDGGQNPKLLRLSANDIVKIYRTVPSGWAGGILLDKTMEEVGLPGWFPMKYVELYKDKENIP